MVRRKQIRLAMQMASEIREFHIAIIDLPKLVLEGALYSTFSPQKISRYAGKRKPYAALLQFRTFLCRKNGVHRGKISVVDMASLVFIGLFVSTTGKFFFEARKVVQKIFFRWWSCTLSVSPDTFCPSFANSHALRGSCCKACEKKNETWVPKPLAGHFFTQRKTKPFQNFSHLSHFFTLFTLLKIFFPQDFSL